MKKLVYIISALCLIASCDADLNEVDFGGKGGGEYAASDGEWGGEGVAPGSGESGNGEGGNSQAGRVTAGEWCDLDNWEFWGKLMNGQDYSVMSSYWGFWTNNRVAVLVTDNENNPVSGVKVALSDAGTELWSTVTDNRGLADCWVGLFMLDEDVDASALKLKVNGEEVEGSPSVTGWDCPNGVAVNKVVLENAVPAAEKADIAFIVDATGSMMDEIQFLKDDLMDILRKVEAKQGGVSFRTGSVFYRDVDDEYVTRTSNFSDQFSTTLSFIEQQVADGGGDYPEAVHTALEVTLQGLSWDETAKTKIAFILLDAPAHKQDNVIESLQKSIKAFAANGIKIIPIAASGADKNTEFMLRFFATATGGTYVFITNDSGIGGDHIEATVGEYEVEILNDLIIRLIEKYTD